jgi:hypothetical protein
MVKLPAISALPRYFIPGIPQRHTGTHEEFGTIASAVIVIALASIFL